MINFEMEWQEVPCTCEPCATCKDIIYGKQYQLFALGEPTETVLCESCYMKVEED